MMCLTINIDITCDMMKCVDFIMSSRVVDHNAPDTIFRCRYQFKVHTHYTDSR